MYYLTPEYFINNDEMKHFTLDEWDNLPFENIITIDFSMSNLTELPNLDKLINLEDLCCNTNQLTELPNLDKLINLKKIDCSYNQLIELPNLDKLVNLYYLNCNNNQLTKLPNLDKLINLIWIRCNNNKFTELHISIRKCKKLEYRYKKHYDIPDYQYIENLSYLINKKIEKYYYKPVLNYYNSIYL